MNEPWQMGLARVLGTHGLSIPDYYLLCTAGYRVTLDRSGFVDQAACEFKGRDWPATTANELDSALDRLVLAGLLAILTESDNWRERERRSASTVPELDDGVYYQDGHVDFTDRGYVLYRELIRVIHGEGFLRRTDAGVNLDAADRRLDVYARSAADCERLMDEMVIGGDSSTGAEATIFVRREGPNAIGPWRSNRFLLHPSGYHGVLRYTCPEPRDGADSSAPPQ